jgi:hypothetical protein
MIVNYNRQTFIVQAIDLNIPAGVQKPTQDNIKLLWLIFNFKLDSFVLGVIPWHTQKRPYLELKTQPHLLKFVRAPSLA